MIKPELVQFVYVGKNGKCMCGCSGKYSYAAAHRAAASKWRGYEVKDYEVNDRAVRLALRRIAKKGDDIVFEGDHAYVIDGNSIVVAYFVKE